MSRSISTVEYERPDGTVVELTMEFEALATDHYWDASRARDFYADRIAYEQGKVLRYGSGPALQNRLRVTYDVTGLSPDEIAGLAMEAVVQSEASEHHPNVPVVAEECDRLPKEEVQT